jgi:TatD DNase family protein
VLVDSHCHIPLIDYGAIPGGIETVLQAARDVGVNHLLCVSIDLESLPKILQIADANAGVFASVGVHPNSEVPVEPTVEELLELSSHPLVVAVGETGLDYYRSRGDLAWQHERFRIHIRAARGAGKPLIIHARDARGDVIQILREESAEETGGVMHCFVEDWATAEAALDLGFYISFSGIVTFKNAREVQDVARRVPENRLLIETDSPYLAPVPHRGKQNQPAFVTHVAEFLATLRGVSFQHIAAVTTENFFRLFPDAQQA